MECTDRLVLFLGRFFLRQLVLWRLVCVLGGQHAGLAPAGTGQLAGMAYCGCGNEKEP